MVHLCRLHVYVYVYIYAVSMSVCVYVHVDSGSHVLASMLVFDVRTYVVDALEKQCKYDERQTQLRKRPDGTMALPCRFKRSMQDAKFPRSALVLLLQFSVPFSCFLDHLHSSPAVSSALVVP